MPQSSDISTPPFVVWSLAVDCVYREEAEANDPTRVERVLRPLRASAEALADARCCDGICVHASFNENDSSAEALGFVLSDTLIPFGGGEAAEQACRECWANVAAAHNDEPRWAGCHGLLIAHDLKRLQAMIDTSWYGLWRESPLTTAALERHTTIWNGLADDDVIVSGVSAFRRAIRVCLECDSSVDRTLHIAAFPPGVRSARYWHVPAHCRKCSAIRKEATAKCGECGSSESPEPARRRMARGQRPYWPIVKLLGDAGAEAFLRRYHEARADCD